MASVNMFNYNEKNLQQQHYSNSFMDPRISFSNDFVQHTQPDESKKYKEAPTSSSDFEFGLKDYGMISADEIFFEGVMVPLKCAKRVTLREELCGDGDGDYEEDEGNNGFEGSVMVRVKRSSWWRERLGLKPKRDQKRDIFAFSHGGGDGGCGNKKTPNCLAHILECDD